MLESTTIMTTIRVGEDQVLEQITRTILEHLRPRRVVLFGSRARASVVDRESGPRAGDSAVVPGGVRRGPPQLLLA
jgi:hypothetical protein